jgi:hypothetical protein
MYSGCACQHKQVEEGAKDLSSFFSSLPTTLLDIPKNAFQQLPQEGQEVIKKLAQQVSGWSAPTSSGALSASFLTETHDKSCVQKIYQERDEMRTCLKKTDAASKQ